MAGKPPAIWNARDAEHVRFWRRHVLAPCIVATRPLDLRTPEAVDDACRAWILSLPEVPEPVLLQGVARLLQTLGPKAWMPRPGDLRGACAAVVADIRAAAAPTSQRLIAECQDCQGTTFVERFNAAGESLGMARCACHARALAVTSGLPTPIALPAGDDAATEGR